MPIRIQQDDDVPTMFGRGGTYPIFVCDHCGKRIADGNMGMFLEASDAYERGRVTEVAFAHKGLCVDALTDSGRYPYADELSDFVRFLALNAKLGDVVGAPESDDEVGDDA